MKFIRNTIEKLLISFITSTMFFSVFDLSFKLYGIIFLLISLLLITKFKRNRAELCALYIIIGFSTLTSFPVANYIKNGKFIINADIIDIALLLTVAILLLIAFVILSLAKAEKSDYNFTLTKSQKHDADRIIKYIKRFNIVGINGAWGTGKSYVLDYIIKKSEIANNHIFIKIDSLSCNLDQIQSVIFDSISRVLNNEHVFSKSTKITKKFLSNMSILDSMYSLLTTDEISYSDALNTLKQELNNINKSVIIIYEDIDRINDIEIIKKIFSISEQLVCEKIKILYQYHDDNLEEIGFNRKYVEKYIPYVVNLTPIDLMKIIKHMFEIDNYGDNIKLDDFKFLNIPTFIKMQKFEYQLSLQTYGCSIRKVKLFLNELAEALDENSLFTGRKYKKKLICFFIIKHFYYDLYKEFAFVTPILETVKFEYEEKSYTAHELKKHFEENNLNNEESYKKLISNDNNRVRIFFLENIGYKLPDSQSTKKPEKLSDIYNKDAKMQEVIEENETNDRLVWNLMFNGKSEYTNNQNAVNEFTAKVLNAHVQYQDEAFKKFDTDMFEENLYKDDNLTIFRFGVKQMYSIFVAFYLSEANSETWKKLIDFYIPSKADKINASVIGSFKMVKLSSNSLYIHALEKFNSMQIISNFNDEKYYMQFLQKYLGALSRFGYINTHELNYIYDATSINESKNEIIKIFDEFIKKLNKLKNTVNINAVQNNINTILRFIEKNKEIMSCKSHESNEPNIKTTIQSKRMNEKEYNRLLALKNTPDFYKEIEESYKLGKITAYEISELMNELQN